MLYFYRGMLKFAKGVTLNDVPHWDAAKPCYTLAFRGCNRCNILKRFRIGTPQNRVTPLQMAFFRVPMRQTVGFRVFREGPGCNK
jgi:hypothetical protein